MDFVDPLKGAINEVLRLMHQARLQPSSFINNLVLSNSRKSVQFALDKFGRNSTEHIAAIATHEDLHQVLAEMTANGTITKSLCLPIKTKLQLSRKL